MDEVLEKAGENWDRSRPGPITRAAG